MIPFQARLSRASEFQLNIEVCIRKPLCDQKGQITTAYGAVGLAIHDAFLELLVYIIRQAVGDKQRM